MLRSFRLSTAATASSALFAAAPLSISRCAFSSSSAAESHSNKRRTYYAILGVNPDASPMEIKMQYRILAPQLHPDTAPAHHKDKSAQEFRQVAEAYSVLSNPNRRREYDDQMMMEEALDHAEKLHQQHTQHQHQHQHQQRSEAHHNNNSSREATKTRHEKKNEQPRASATKNVSSKTMAQKKSVKAKTSPSSVKKTFSSKTSSSIKKKKARGAADKKKKASASPSSVSKKKTQQQRLRLSPASQSKTQQKKKKQPQQKQKQQQQQQQQQHAYLPALLDSVHSVSTSTSAAIALLNQKSQAQVMKQIVSLDVKLAKIDARAEREREQSMKRTVAQVTSIMKKSALDAKKQQKKLMIENEKLRRKLVALMSR